MRRATWTSWRAVLPALCLATTHPGAAAASHGDAFGSEIACSKAAGFTSAECRMAFALARAEYEIKTRSYLSRFACYRAYGPCSPWPTTGGLFRHFRPQWMGVTFAGTGATRVVVPVVAPGKTKLAFAAHALSNPLPAMAAVAATPSAPAMFAETPATDALCRQIEAGAARAHLPPAFLARLLWQESSFRPHVVSRAGALGIAQFMPGTALERGLDDPFDPARAIETSAALLGDLAKRFGNLGLAAAAYNGGPARVSGWLRGRRTLAAETEAYVRNITGRSVDEWVARADADTLLPPLGPCAAAKADAAR